MIETLKPYPKYKDSRLPWLTNLPMGWQILRGKSVFSVVDIRSQTGNEELLTVSSADGVVPRNQKTVTMFKAKSYIGHKLCWPGDLVVNSLWAWMQGLGVTQLHGLVSSAYSVYRPRREFTANAQFFHYLLRSAAYKWELQTRSKGVWLSRLQLSDPAFMDMPILVPPSEEQVAIVRFLKDVNRRTERAIQAKKKLIALLNEQKHAIIHRAVTRGLDPTVPLKSSGIRGLGDVPEHWSLSRVKNEFQCLNNRRVPLSASERGVMTLRQYDYYGASGIIDKVDGYLFDDDLLLIAEDGANLVLRNLPLAIIARGKFWVNNHAHILKPKRGNLEYLANLMEAIDYSPWISGAAQPKLTKDRLMAVQIPVPPPSEQERTQEWIAAELSPLQAAVAHAQREIDLIREYRNRLVADVVTGKLDVRDAARDLPAAEAEEPAVDAESEELVEKEALEPIN